MFPWSYDNTMLIPSQSTMVWAIDLDDGSLIDSLGSNMGRPKKKIAPDAPLGGPDLGTGRMKEL